MFKITALALVIALCNAEKDSSSRLLLQAGAPPAQGPPLPPGPPTQTTPSLPVLQQPAQPAPVQPVQPAPYNPYNPYGQVQQPYNPYNPYQSMNNVNNPYCSPMFGMYDMQKCLEYGAFYGSPVANPGFGYNPYNPGFGYAPPFNGMAPIGQAPPAQGTVPGARPAAPAPPQMNMNNPYCNPYSGMYDYQDCMRFSYGFFW